MLIDDPKFKVLAELVQDARVEDKRTLDAMNQANATWKAANATLTERTKVLNDYVAQQVSEHTATPKE